MRLTLYSSFLILLAQLPSCMAARQPNILWTMSEDHAAHALGAYGGRLVENGVRFLQIFSSGWDNHDYLERGHSSRIRSVDNPRAALNQELLHSSALDIDWSVPFNCGCSSLDGWYSWGSIQIIAMDQEGRWRLPIAVSIVGPEIGKPHGLHMAVEHDQIDRTDQLIARCDISWSTRGSLAAMTSDGEPSHIASSRVKGPASVKITSPARKRSAVGSNSKLL